MLGERGLRRVAAWLVAGLTGLVIVAPPVQAAPSTAWIANRFEQVLRRDTATTVTEQIVASGGSREIATAIVDALMGCGLSATGGT